MFVSFVDLVFGAAAARPANLAVCTHILTSPLLLTGVAVPAAVSAACRGQAQA